MCAIQISKFNLSSSSSPPPPLFSPMPKSVDFFLQEIQFRMCKSKRRSDGAEPIATPRSSRSPKPSQRSPTSTRSSDAPYDSLNRSSSTAASISTGTSLSSLRSSLPQQPLIFDFSEICSVTNNFLARPLSAASTAWRCSLRGRDAVVLRRKFRRPIDSFRLHKCLALICRAHHASLVDLLGASIAGDHIYLVYDHVPGSSLADCLRNPKNPNFTVLSSWMSRIQIATDVAQGLDYIHNHALPGSSLVHNRIKATSIIVTEPSFRAKIRHFGAAELSGENILDYDVIDSEIPADSPRPLKPREQSRSDTDQLRIFEGARGYMSPEYKSSGVGTQKSDVFAFGVVLLELLSGDEPLRYEFDRSSRCYRRISVIERARDAVDGDDGSDHDRERERERERDEDEGGRGGRLRRWVDPRLKDSFPVSVARRMTRVALECVDLDPERRPEMGRVAGKISNLYLKSQIWSDRMRVTADQTLSFAPR
ncbi:lysM domain receptor-like kinase 3 [Malania oleifera]|uniref:lysM domain receptor-like kinase 3 n=1 Tax=Malania oleifera TaxID=397392 RepID=UPI0025AE51FB|nr:lysM domain receptor-like kinase 3 [Malania oleifera]